MMIARLLSLTVMVTTTAAVTFDQKRIYSSQVDVLSPHLLLGQLDHRSALFGEFPVGASIQGNIYYTRRSLCGDEVPGTPEFIRGQGYFLLVDRGGCSFVEKVRNAQRENATAVFIADDTCLCSFPDDVCAADKPCENSEPTMDDDGTGDDIRIPSMLLLKPDGDKLKNELVSGQTIELQLSWPVPKAVNGVTEYTLWMTPDDLLSHHFLFSFLDTALALGSKAIFRPSMLVHDGTEHGCRKYDGNTDPCPGSCTNYGRYCEPRSYYEFTNYDDKGILMMIESLRRACIWHIYGAPDGIGSEWWTYVQLWIQRCGGSHYSTACAENIYQTAGITGDLIEQCMEDSGNVRNDVANTFYDQSIDEAMDFDVTFAPSLFINGAIIRGSLTFGSVLEAICMTYEEGDIPDVCYTWEACAASCAADKTCILHGVACIPYEVPQFNYGKDVYDDDYINDDESVMVVVEKNESTVVAGTRTPSLAATQAPVPAPTDAPTARRTQAPTKSSGQPPVPPPTDPPGPELGLIPNNNNAPAAGMVETIQIYEGGRGPAAVSGNGGGSDGLSFGAGLGIGIGAAVVIGVLIYLLIRDHRRNSGGRRRRWGRKKGRGSYSVPASELSIEEEEDGYYSEEEESFEDEAANTTTSRARIYNPRKVHKDRPQRSSSRRTVRRPRQATLDPSYRRSRPEPIDEEERRPLESRPETAARHARTYRDEIDDDELVSIPYVDGSDDGSEEEY